MIFFLPPQGYLTIIPYNFIQTVEQEKIYTNKYLLYLPLCLTFSSFQEEYDVLMNALKVLLFLQQLLTC